MPFHPTHPHQNPRPRRRRRPVDLARAARDWLPRGRQLPERLWYQRHRGITLLLWLHVPALIAFGLSRGRDPLHLGLDMVPLVVLAVVAGMRKVRRPARSIAGAAGLVTCSALLVHLSDGTAEAHFHFFVMMPLLMLYQDWTPFLVATGYVILHHGVMGAASPNSVYNHPGAIEHPWRWAMIHGGFILAAGAASMISWRASERLLTDPLTGLNSRFVLHDRLAAALERLRPGTTLAVMFIDLDRFKLVNDTLGHGAGDRLLTTMADRLKSCLRPMDTAVRFGGDEFVVICGDLSGVDEARTIAERIGTLLREPMSIDGHDLALTISVGIALTDTGDTAPEALVRDADTAMYSAKAEGRNRCAVFDGALRENLLEDLEIEADLRHALARGEFRLLYQPILDLRTGDIGAVETLLRWEHPRRGTLRPAAFMRVAQECGAIIEIGHWMLGEACDQLAAWRSEGRATHIRVDVNLCPRQLVDPELLGFITRSLDAAGLSPGDLCLEITEGSLLQDLDRGAEMLGAIRDLGVRLTLDDFGTGHSSVGHLRRLTLDALKVDQSFVHDLEKTSDAEPIVRAIVALGHALGLDVIAEGVETAAQLRTVHALGCDAAQGYILARPAPGARVGRVLGGPSDAANLFDYLALAGAGPER